MSRVSVTTAVIDNLASVDMPNLKEYYTEVSNVLEKAKQKKIFDDETISIISTALKLFDS